MERQVIYRDRQELQAADLNNAQLFADESFQHVITDAITAEKMFVGLNITSPAATEIEIAAGRLWDGPVGKVFRKDEAERISIFSYLPVTDEKWLAISVIGQEVETDIQPRDFEIDAETGQMEPRAVAMESRSEVVSLITPGMESPDPQKPEEPTNYTLVGYVLLNSSGVQEIEMADNKKLMRLFDTHQTVLANAAWITTAAPKIASLMTDMSALMAKINAATSGNMIVAMAGDIAAIKETLALPSSYNAYESDDFFLIDESDETDPTYHARIDMGLRFPWAGLTEQQLALFNPYEVSVVNKNGLVLPAYDLEARLKTTGGAGSLNISQYAYKTSQRVLGTRTRVRIYYGEGNKWKKSGGKWGHNLTHRVVDRVFHAPETPPTTPKGERIRKDVVAKMLKDDGTYTTYIKYTWIEPYWYTINTKHTINGCEIAQTVLISQSGWLAEIGLWFSKVGADGAVHLAICECSETGEPLPERAIAMTQVEAANLSTGEVPFRFPQPVFLDAGKRYSLVIATGGNHSVTLVQGTEYIQGTLFKSTDGDYYQPHTNYDLKLSLYFCQFRENRVTVGLNPISLAEGICALDLLAPWTEPASTSLVLEYQADGTGTWVPVAGNTSDALHNLPAMCNLRATFVGTKDLMPGLELPGSRLRAQRPDVDFLHLSTMRTLSTPSADIDVILLLDDYDPAHHTCVVKLIDGETEYTGTVTTTALDDRTTRHVTHFSPNDPAGITNYKIKIQGTTDSALLPYIVSQRMDVAK
ncbi:hypothetical protein [Dethiosulfatarculus sandiegensis]|uniref:Uncharacterized protein n=1 Tax=Dethiosulfatarculus sandiegensis TaxID=1429043 RepID=A0A0D2HXL5_9BACT|nr:hypothetical protein [Dethiosulfatarculus sandiegensis]KIX15038.1 hypothetical protein X474_05775 [Dethiosulfatarculus sandiegensis]